MKIAAIVLMSLATIILPSLQVYATDMNYVIQLCQGALQHPENELMYKTCSQILINIEANKTKNQFSCECQWTTQMTPVNDGKLCEYKCNCECDGNKNQNYFNSIVALSQQVVAGETLAYDCQGQQLVGFSESTPEWKKTLVGIPFKVNSSEITPVKSDLKIKIDQAISCN